MADRFNFYDFLGYIIPGAFVTLLFIYTIGSIFGTLNQIFSYISGLGETIIFLMISYLVGHLIQARGRQIELKEKDKWGGYFSIQFLREGNQFYTAKFKDILKKKAKAQFGLDVDISGNQQDKRHQEIFNLCYAFVVQKGVSRQTDIFNAIYGMFRALLAIREIAVFLFSVLTLYNIVTLSIVFFNHGLGWYQAESINLIVSLVLLGISVVSYKYLSSRFQHFAQRFVDSIFQNFLIYVLTNK
jgi:hypothetical protein